MVTITLDEKKLIDKVEKRVCDHFGINEQLVINKGRKSQVSMARGYIYYILHYDYNLSITQISNTYFLTRRAIFWHVSKVKHLLKQRIYKGIYDEICELINK